MRWFSIVLGFILALFMAGAASATVTTSRAQPGGWVVSFVNGDTADSAAIDNTCATWRVSFDLGGGSAAATIYGITNSSDATSAGTALTNGTLTAASLAAPVVVSTALPYIKVDVVTGPSSGTARVWLFCTATAGGGDGGSIVLATAEVTDNVDTEGTPTAIPGLVVPVQANTSYHIHCELVASANGGTTGIETAVISGPAGFTGLSISHRSPSSATAVSNQLFNTYGNTHEVTASAGNVRANYFVDVVLLNGATAGNLVFGLDVEDASGGSVTAHLGSHCEYQVLG